VAEEETNTNHINTIRSSNQPKIIWDDTNMKSVYASFAQVKAAQEEVMLLFGTKRTTQLDQNELQVKLNERIVLNPIAAKRLLVVLNKTVQEYESIYGPLDDGDLLRNKLKLVLPPCLPRFKSGVTIKKVALLFQLLENLKLKVAFERSFKFSNKTLLGNRFLLGIQKKSITQDPHEKLLDICARMNMPNNLQKTFQKNLPAANIVAFGIEENEKTCIVKAYLEFGSKYKEAFKKKPEQPNPYLSHLGFKWDSVDNSRFALTNYRCFPAFTVEDILMRLSNRFYRQNSKNPFEIIKGILNLASSKVGHGKVLYLDVSEENNPRMSFDINIYEANICMKELHLFFLEICRHYSISDEQFHCLYEPVKNQVFGHLAGGLDRNGKSVLAIYFGD